MSPALERPSSDRRRELEAIFEAETPYVLRTLRRLGVAETDAEDLAHEVFVTVYRRLSDYDPSRPMRPWLFGIAFRVAVGFRRLARHRHEVVGTDLAEGSECPVEQLEARDVVLRALSRMKLGQRAVLAMHDIDGYSIPEVADALEIPLNTAYSRLRAARRDFKTAVEHVESARGAS